MNLSKISNVLVVISLFWFALQPAIDPDTGWHLATGRFIIQNQQLPQTDPFSYSLPNHPYIAHSWVFDIVMYAVTQLTGLLGLSIVYAVITTAIFVVIAKIASLVWPEQQYVPYLPLIAYPSIEIIGQRPQAVSILGLLLLIYCLLNWQPAAKKWLPVLFLIWTNLHAGVLLGVVVFFAWLIIEAVTQKSMQGFTSKSKIWFICLLATLLNPYTYHIYTFALGMITNQTSAIYNSDWVPLFSSQLDASSLGLRLAIVAAAVVAIVDNPVPKTLRYLSLGWLILAFKSLRYLVPLLSTVSPLVVLTSARLAKTLNQKSWFAIITTLSIGVIFYQPLVNKSEVICSNHIACYSQQAQMPFGAVEYLKSKQLNGNIFNLYTWGGFLSWQLPESKVFIDGRMDNFFLNDTSFLQEFVSIHHLEPNWYQKIQNYQTDFILIPADWRDFQAAVIKEKWQVIYKDDLSILFQKP